GRVRALPARACHAGAGLPTLEGRRRARRSFRDVHLSSRDPGSRCNHHARHGDGQSYDQHPHLPDDMRGGPARLPRLPDEQPRHDGPQVVARVCPLLAAHRELRADFRRRPRGRQPPSRQLRSSRHRSSAARRHPARHPVRHGRGARGGHVHADHVVYVPPARAVRPRAQPDRSAPSSAPGRRRVAARPDASGRRSTIALRPAADERAAGHGDLLRLSRRAGEPPRDVREHALPLGGRADDLAHHADLRDRAGRSDPGAGRRTPGRSGGSPVGRDGEHPSVTVAGQRECRRLVVAWAIVLLAAIAHRLALFVNHRPGLEALVSANRGWFDVQALPPELLRERFGSALLYLQQTPPVPSLIEGAFAIWFPSPPAANYWLIWLQILCSLATAAVLMHVVSVLYPGRVVLWTVVGLLFLFNTDRVVMEFNALGHVIYEPLS